jgi:hypothetical protein
MAPSYTPGQRTSISQFVSFTQSKESIAAKVRFTPIQSVPVPRALPLLPLLLNPSAVLRVSLKRLLTLLVSTLRITVGTSSKQSMRMYHQHLNSQLESRSSFYCQHCCLALFLPESWRERIFLRNHSRHHVFLEHTELHLLWSLLQYLIASNLNFITTTQRPFFSVGGPLPHTPICRPPHRNHLQRSLPW